MSALRYVSHEVVLEPERWLVRLGERVVTPEPKVFELLCYLMRHPGRVVAKGELLDALWGGDVVGESVLTRCVSCARKLLADDSKTPRFIRTLHGRGYEFIAPVNAVASGVASVPAVAGVTPTESAEVAPHALPDRGFVGRRGEARFLGDAIRRLGPEPRDFVLISGEAGIGKTRLLHEVTRSAPAGVELHWAACSPVEGAPPFLVWQQCFRSVARQRSTKTVLRAFGEADSEARRLVLGSGRSSRTERLGWESPNQRFRTFDAICQGLAELARQRPLVLVLDDLHFADLGSLLLLTFLTQQHVPGLLILAAVRDAERLDEARARALGELRASCRAELPLSGLNATEVLELVEHRFGQGQEQLASSLHARTGGNPFYLSVLTMSREAASASETLLPSAIRKAVSQRLRALSPECVRLLRLASVLGRELDAALLSRAAEQPHERCLRLLEAGSAARVIASAQPGQYRFVHDLMREVLYAEQSAAERAEAHLAVGRALDAMSEHRQPRHAAMLAHHFAQGAHLGGAARALDLSIAAGGYALRHFAYEEAIEHFSRASQLLAQAPETDAATECALLLDLGLSQISAGQRDAGQSSLHAAAARARELGAVSELASVALSLVPGLFAIEVGGYDPALVQLLREALSQVGENRRLRALLLARLALALYWGDTFDERVAICAEAMALAEASSSDEVKAGVITACALALLRPSNLSERQQLTARAVELCGRVGDHHGLLLNRLHRAALLLEAGDLGAAALEADGFRRLAEEVQQPQALWIARALQACRLLLDGRLPEVEAIAAECLQAGQRVRDHNALQTFGVHLTLLRVEQGRGRELLEVLRNYAASYPRTVTWRAVYAFALCRSGELADCRAQYESTKLSGFSLPDDLLVLPGLAFLTEVCSVLGDAEGAALLYERFAPFSGRFVVIGYGIACLGAVDRYLGMLSATLGRREAAARHFERAIEQNRRLGASLPLAYSQFDYARLIAQQAPAQARACLAEAERIAAERGLAQLAERIANGGIDW
ncbi:MAG TPA: AAA family ATPase [Polyangiaceae bacterium]|nr:AAA family ATPase [Polyangiaceae bacterium]